jgi:hypothetical protein
MEVEVCAIDFFWVHPQNVIWHMPDTLPMIKELCLISSIRVSFSQQPPHFPVVAIRARGVICTLVCQPSPTLNLMSFRPQCCAKVRQLQPPPRVSSRPSLHTTALRPSSEERFTSRMYLLGASLSKLKMGVSSVSDAAPSPAQRHHPRRHSCHVSSMSFRLPGYPPLLFDLLDLVSAHATPKALPGSPE